MKYCSVFFVLLMALSSYGQAQLRSDAATSVATTTPPSSTAQQLFSAAKSDLLQLRVLTKSSGSQNSIGSAFLIGEGHFAITNYHVIAQIALEPATYKGEFRATDGESGEFELMAVDVLHDLAVVRVSRKGTGFFQLPIAPHDTEQPPLAHLRQGQPLYSLGNPLDLGFTISEGTYNGETHRGFSANLMFTGPVNPGMSGGPNVTASGELAGINVAHRRDGELVSFLVPAVYAQTLLAHMPDTPPADFEKVIGEQLLAHQQIMVDTVLATPFTTKQLGPYLIPLRESEQLRCWGSSRHSDEKTYSIDSINCDMESSVFVSSDLSAGRITLSHKLLQNKTLHTLQFAQLASNLFSNQIFSTTASETLTSAFCNEDFVSLTGFSARAQVCIEAYHDFEGLYDFTLITASTDDKQQSLQSMMNILGVSYDSGTRLINQFLSQLSRPSIIDNASDRNEVAP